MAVAGAAPGGYLERPKPSGLADVIDIILDKGLVIDAYVRVSLIGIELLTIDARIVVASVDTYLRFAEAVGRLDLAEADQSQSLPDLLDNMGGDGDGDGGGGGGGSKTRGALDGVKDKLGIGEGDDDDDDDEGRAKPRRRRSSAQSSRRRDSDEE